MIARAGGGRKPLLAFEGRAGRLELLGPITRHDSDPDADTALDLLAPQGGEVARHVVASQSGRTIRPGGRSPEFLPWPDSAR